MAQRVVVGEGRMVEITGWVTGHAEPLHDAPGALVHRYGESDDLGEPEPPEAVVEHRPSGFRRITLSPIRAGQPPAKGRKRGRDSPIAPISGASPGKSTAQ